MLKVRLKKRRGNFTLDAEFEMPTPGVVALFGRSGCGKSTLVDGMAGLLRPDLGRIELDGELPLNTFGGSLGTGRIHGLWHIIEGALQASGRAGSRQVKDANVSFVGASAPIVTGTTFIFVGEPY